MIKLRAGALVLPAVLLTAMAAARPAPADGADKGKAAFAACAVCHGTTPSAKGVGPTLFGVVGRNAGQFSTPVPSPALSKFGKVWTAAELDAFLATPAKAIPGNRMPFGGIADAAKRKAIIAYLATLK